MPDFQFRWAKNRDNGDSDVIVTGQMGAYVATVSGASEEFRAHLMAAINRPALDVDGIAQHCALGLGSAEPAHWEAALSDIQSIINAQV